MIYEIKKYGNPILRKRSRRITDINGEIKKLAENMLETMHAYNGIGLAAQQIGRLECICVIDIPQETSGGKPIHIESDPPIKMPLVLINPLIEMKEDKVVLEEGCLSFPGIFTPVASASIIVVKYYDLNGTELKLKAGGLLATAIQHEMDHLKGKLLVDRMSVSEKMKFMRELETLREEGRKQPEEPMPSTAPKR